MYIYNVSVGPVHSEEVWSAQQWKEARASPSLPDPTETTDQQRPQESHHRRPTHAGSQRDLLRGVWIYILNTIYTTIYALYILCDIYMYIYCTHYYIHYYIRFIYPM